MAKTDFRAALAKRGIAFGTNLGARSLNEFFEDVSKALRETVPNSDEMELPWIGVEPMGRTKVRMVVSPRFSGCSDSRE